MQHTVKLITVCLEIAIWQTAEKLFGRFGRTPYDPMEKVKS